MASRVVPFSSLAVNAEFRFPGATSHWIKLSSTDYRLAEWEQGTHPRSRAVHHVDSIFPMDVVQVGSRSEPACLAESSGSQ